MFYISKGYAAGLGRFRKLHCKIPCILHTFNQIFLYFHGFSVLGADFQLLLQISLQIHGLLHGPVPLALLIGGQDFRPLRSGRFVRLLQHRVFQIFRAKEQVKLRIGHRQKLQALKLLMGHDLLLILYNLILLLHRTAFFFYSWFL